MRGYICSTLTALATLAVQAGVAAPARAAALFSGNFESGVLAPDWTSTNGQIVIDPLDAANHVLHFTADKSAGDAFTAAAVALPAGGTYAFSFDFLGTGAGAFALAGISPVNTTVPTAGWVFASQPFGSGFIAVPRKAAKVNRGPGTACAAP